MVKFKVNFIGNFQNGYVGEVGDATHLAREMASLGHIVTKVPQDVWKAYIDGYPVQDDWVLPQEADINIICKWPHFDKPEYITKLREVSGAPVFYWVWDLMGDGPIIGWHSEMVRASDLYLGNDVHSPYYSDFKNAYYLPFDVADGDIARCQAKQKTIDVAFFGSWVGKGDRQVWLKEINKTNPVTVYSWNYKDWPAEFTNVHPAVYGEEFARKVGESKIILGFSVEPNLWGYWSNRTGKILTLGGFLLYQYAPGMELFLRDGVEYFSSIEEAQEKIDHYLIANLDREEIARKGFQIGQHRFTSQERVKDLLILIDRYLKTGGKHWQI